MLSRQVISLTDKLAEKDIILLKQEEAALQMAKMAANVARLGQLETAHAELEDKFKQQLEETKAK